MNISGRGDYIARLFLVVVAVATLVGNFHRSLCGSKPHNCIETDKSVITEK